MLRLFTLDDPRDGSPATAPTNPDLLNMVDDAMVSLQNRLTNPIQVVFETVQMTIALAAD